MSNLVLLLDVLSFNIRVLILFLFGLNCFLGQLNAQTFEGTLQFVMKAEASDPKLRQEQEKQMQKSREALADPAMEKNIRELELQMQKPEFQKQLEKNPELKKMMEQQIVQLKKMRSAALENPSADPLHQGGLLRMTMKFKDGNMLTYSGGLVMDMYGVNQVTLYRQTDKKCYELDNQTKTYQELIPDAASDGKENEWAIQLTSLAKDSTIQGFVCRKYAITMTHKTDKKSIKGLFWVAPAIKAPQMNTTWQQNPMMGAFSRIEGTPLHMEMEMSEGMKMTYKLESVKKEKLNAADFAIPAGYRKK